MTRDDHDKRQAIIDACRRMNALGINQGTSGNISVRHGDGLLTTPTSVPYEMVAGGDSIRCSPYAAYGTPELSQYALTALEGRFEIGQPPLLPKDEIERVRVKMADCGLSGA